MNDQEVIVLTAPTVFRDDIEQEAALLRLLGKTPNRAIILKKLSRYEAYLTDFSAPISWGDQVWSQSPQVELETIQRITEWAMTQSDQICEMIFHFLDGEVALEPVLKKLKDSGIIEKKSDRPIYEYKVTLTDLILEKLKEPTHISDLYELGRSFLNSKRPEAAVRQILRRFIAKELIEREGDVYSIPRW